MVCAKIHFQWEIQKLKAWLKYSVYDFYTFFLGFNIKEPFLLRTHNFDSMNDRKLFFWILKSDSFISSEVNHGSLKNLPKKING